MQQLDAVLSSPKKSSSQEESSSNTDPPYVAPHEHASERETGVKWAGLSHTASGKIDYDDFDPRASTGCVPAAAPTGGGLHTSQSKIVAMQVFSPS